MTKKPGIDFEALRDAVHVLASDYDETVKGYAELRDEAVALLLAHISHSETWWQRIEELLKETDR